MSEESAKATRQQEVRDLALMKAKAREGLVTRLQADLRKEIPDLLAQIHEGTLENQGTDVRPIIRTLAHFSTLLGVLYIKADIQTRRVLVLTWALVGLTGALLLLTGYLCYDAYLKQQGEDEQRNHRTEPQKANVEIHSLRDLL